MNHENVTTKGMLRVCRTHPDAPPTEKDFAGLVQNAALRTTQAEVVEGVERLLLQTDPMLSDMEEEMDRLKENFIEALRTVLELAGIEPDDRLVLGLETSAMCLEANDAEHPKAKVLNAVLANRPELASALREIAIRSLLLRGLQDLGEAMEGLAAPVPTFSSDDNIEAEGGTFCRLSEQNDFKTDLLRSYHVCLKGALSHFYFSLR